MFTNTRTVSRRDRPSRIATPQRVEGIAMTLISLRNLRHSYLANPKNGCRLGAQGNQRRLVEDGGAYALLGPSGCGKTTLLNIISGLLTPSDGEIWFGDSNVTDYADRPAQYRAGVPVSGRLRHHDRLRQSRLSASQSRDRRAGRGQEGPRDRLHARPRRHAARQRASGLTADGKQKISLGRGLVRTRTSTSSCSTNR